MLHLNVRFFATLLIWLILVKEKIMIYGYCRCSTDKQTLANQRFEISRFTAQQKIKINRWVCETISSRKTLSNRKLGVLLGNLKQGDVLIATELSRLGRSLLEVMNILQQCLEKNCQIWTLKENYRLGADIQSKVLAFAFGLSAEIERQLISERTRMSLAKLKEDGRKLGRPLGAKATKLKLETSVQKIKNLRADGMTKVEIARILGVNRSTLYRFLKN